MLANTRSGYMGDGLVLKINHIAEITILLKTVQAKTGFTKTILYSSYVMVLS